MSDTSKQNDEDHRDPATRAFDALRDELASVRQSMEDLRAGIQQSRPHDYRKTLGEILRAQQSVDVELQAIKSHPAINLTPDRFSHQLEEAKKEAIRADRRDLKIIMDALMHNCITLRNYMEVAYKASHQRIMIASSGLIFFMVGTLFSNFTVSTLANLAPTSWQAPESIASSIMGMSMHNAGIRLINTDNPKWWQIIQDDNRIMNENREAVEKCKNELLETKRQVKCIIAVK
jgi:Family of unknown function (DUF6118)